MSDQQFLLQLTDLLRQITAPNSAAIKAASSQLQKEFYPQKQTLPALIQILQQNQEIGIRQLAAVESRKLIDSQWEELDESIKADLKASLLQSTLQEQSGLVKHASSRVISQIATKDLSGGKWPDLLVFLQKTALSDVPSDREIGVYILYTLLDSAETILLNSLGDIFSLFSRTINDPESLVVRTNTLLGLGKISEILEADSTPEYVQMFRSALPAMVEVLKQLINEQDEKAVNQAFDVFQTLLLVDSALIAKSLGDLVQFMVQIASEKSLEPEFRVPAIQFLISAVRFKKLKIQSMKLGPTLTSVALNIASEDIGDLNSEDEDNASRVALYLIDTLSTSLPPTQVMNTLLTTVPSMVNSADANARRAGLLAMGVAVEGSPDFVSTQINIILPLILQGLRDSVLEVRVAALQSLAQLADELQDSISKEHAVLLPLVFGMMETSDLKIGIAACTALDAMIETMEKDVIVGYLPTLMQRLLELLNQPSSDVSLKGSVIAAIGSAAHASKDAFLPYYESTIRSFEVYISLKEGEKELDVKARTFDSIAAIANSLGKESFNQFANPIVNAAYESLQGNHTKLRESAFLFFGTIAKVYGSEFASFLPQLMPEVFKCLEQDEGATLFPEELNGDADDHIGEADEEDVWQNITVNSAMAIEKEVAADTIGDLIVGTKEAFLPYMEKSSEILIELSKHFYEGIRKAAVGSLWRALITIYEISKPARWQAGLPLRVPLSETVTTFAAMVRTATLEMLDEEDDRSTATIVCDNLAEAIRECGPGIVGDDLENILTQMLAILKGQHRCQTMENDPEEEEYEDSAEYDILLIDSAMDVVVALAAAFGSDFGNYFRTFCPIILKYCSSSTEGERKSGTGALAEIVNGMKSAITPWSAQLLKAFTHRISDEAVEVRSNAIYGYGLLCEYSQDSNDIVATYPKFLQRLQQNLVSDSDNFRCVANICGCVARMTHAHVDKVPLNEALPALVYALPLKDGFEENDPIFRLIVDLYRNNNPVVQGLTNNILTVLEQLFTNDTVDNKQFEFEETKQQVKDLLRFLNQNNPGMIQSEVLLRAI
ncbi:armadillo-type protein [Dipodascopsis uninucleata]